MESGDQVNKSILICVYTGQNFVVTERETGETQIQWT